MLLSLVKHTQLFQLSADGKAYSNVWQMPHYLRRLWILCNAPLQVRMKRTVYSICGDSLLGSNTAVILVYTAQSGGTNINEGYRYGRLSLEMYDEFKNEAWLCRVSAAFYGCICTWKEPVSKTIKPLDHAYRVGLGTGDIEFAVVSKYNLVRTFLFFSFLTSSAIALCEYELLE
jgi:predicted ATPase